MGYLSFPLILDAHAVPVFCLYFLPLSFSSLVQASLSLSLNCLFLSLLSISSSLFSVTTQEVKMLMFADDTVLSAAIKKG